MTEMFINPDALFNKLEQDQEGPKKMTFTGLGQAQVLEPVVSFPIPDLPAPVVEPHYTQVLDQLWAEFDEPQERTAARLDAVLATTIDEAQTILNHKARLWDELPGYKLPETERKRFDREFSDYLGRLNAYRKHLSELAPQSLDTEAVYLGLIRRRDGAGPVPDAVMPLYFAKQLGILEEHGQDMSTGFVARVVRALELADDAIEGSAQKLDELSDASSDKLEDILADASGTIGDGLKTAGLWIAGVVGGTLLVGGAIAAAVVASRRPKAREEQSA